MSNECFRVNRRDSRGKSDRIFFDLSEQDLKCLWARFETNGGRVFFCKVNAATTKHVFLL